MAEPGPPLATLLVADDDPAVRQSLERTLTREGYAVVLAQTPGRSRVLQEVGSTCCSPTQLRPHVSSSPGSQAVARVT